MGAVIHACDWSQCLYGQQHRDDHGSGWDHDYWRLYTKRDISEYFYRDTDL